MVSSQFELNIEHLVNYGSLYPGRALYFTDKAKQFEKQCTEVYSLPLKISDDHWRKENIWNLNITLMLEFFPYSHFWKKKGKK